MTTTTVHSFKGGTGKSLIAVTLGYYLSQQGKKTLVIDGDYYAPCFETFFPTKKDPEPFTAFLKSDCEFKDTIVESSHPKLWVSYAPTPSFGQEILQADVKTHGKYLKRILEGIKTAHEKLGFDEIIIDNSSGISLAAINYLTCSDRSLMIIRPVRYGVETTYEIINTIYRKLRYADPKRSRQDFLVWNQVPANRDSSTTQRIEKYLQYWKKKFSEADIEYGTTIPYNSDIDAAMIADNPLDLPKLTGLIEAQIREIVQGMYE
jgi:MinD-like ATPase involved in chromosome partitioning or flagellar assembly